MAKNRVSFDLGRVPKEPAVLQSTKVETKAKVEKEETTRAPQRTFNIADEDLAYIKGLRRWLTKNSDNPKVSWIDVFSEIAKRLKKDGIEPFDGSFSSK